MNYVLTPAAVQKLKRVVSPRLGGSTDPAATASPVAVDLYPAPFTVRWAASLAEPESSEGAGDATDGEWIIYLPTTGLLKVGATDVNITSALTAAGGIYPTGWYKLLDANDEPILSRSTGGTLYLNVNTSGVPTASFASSSGAGLVAIKIATAAVDSTTGARSVKQFTSSAITYGGATSLPTIYEIITDSSGSGGTERKHFTSRYYELSGILRDGPDIPSGSSLDSSTYKGKFVALVVQGLSNSMSASITPYATLELLRAAQAIKTQLVMPLYKFDSTGAVEIDFRHIPRADAWSLGV